MSGPDAAVALLFFGGAFWVLRPLAAAVARRISGEGAPRRGPVADEAVLAELQALREDVDQMAERLDFAERLLARQRDAPRVGPGS